MPEAAGAGAGLWVPVRVFLLSMLRSPLLSSAQTATRNCPVKYLLDYAPQLLADTNSMFSRCSLALALLTWVSLTCTCDSFTGPSPPQP